MSEAEDTGLDTQTHTQLSDPYEFHFTEHTLPAHTHTHTSPFDVNEHYSFSQKLRQSLSVQVLKDVFV